MPYVICNSIGSKPHCKGCGAAVPHYSDSCEPCPVNEQAHCEAIPIQVGSKVRFYLYGGMPKVTGRVVEKLSHDRWRVQALNGFAEVHELSLEPVIESSKS